MYPIDFSKERAEEILQAINSGEPIPAPAGPSESNPAGGWNRYELLHVAGACQFAAMSHGPATADLEKLKKAHPEHREAVSESLENDLQAAIGFYSQLTMMLHDGEYDQHCEPHVQAVVLLDNEGQQRVNLTKGGKQVL